MEKLSQVSVAVIVLGAVITVIGLFPAIIGFLPSPGIGILKTLTILTGFTILICGALLFVQVSYYPRVKHNLAQQVAIRLSMTGLVFAALCSLADILGYASHPLSVLGQHPTLGPLKASGLIGGFMVASLGVIMFALMGHSGSEGESEANGLSKPEAVDPPHIDVRPTQTPRIKPPSVWQAEGLVRIPTCRWAEDKAPEDRHFQRRLTPLTRRAKAALRQ